MKQITRILSVLSLTLIMSCANAQNTTTIPLDERVRTGKLGNGMTYYIMHNQEPEERVSFYFAQNVGAILEEDSQNGLAHFLEHMAFNGLKHYPGKSMFKYLESYGIKFGNDINAYTAQDETVYMIKNLPSTNENLLDSTMLVLYDWSGGLLLEAEEIEAERGVIHEEWRTRRDSRFRIMKQIFPHMYNHSQYAKRDVIGSLDVIDNFEHQELRDYYKKWYRPDLQAVVIVGDIDVEKVEQKVKDLFSKIPAPKNAAERVYYPVDDTEELGFVLAKDKEAQGVSIDWIFRLDPTTVKDEAYMRNKMAEGMMTSMLNNRLGELTQKPECPALKMQIANFDMARTKKAAYLSVGPKENKEKEAFALLMTEMERVRRFGFTEAELERVKTNYLRQNEAYEKRYDKVDNDQWAEKIGEYFLKAEPFPSLEWEMDFAKKTIADISLSEINQQLSIFKNVNNSLLVVQGPDKEEINYPTKEELLAEVAKVMSSNISAYEDDAVDTPLVTDELSEKEFVSEEPMEGFDGATIYKLENGAKVVVMPTEISTDEILFTAYSFGGSSLVAKDDLASANIATNLAEMSGVGDFNAIQLQKKLTGKLAELRLFLSSNEEGFGGSSSVQDFETLLQLMYQRIEHPRFGKSEFETMLAGMNNQMVYAKADNKKALGDTLSMASTNYHPRTLLFDEELVASLDFDKVQAIYKDRFQDASDFTFVFVGNIDEDKHLPLIKKYVGNLSSTNRSESWVNHGMNPADGHTFRKVERAMATDKATVNYHIYSDVKYNLKTRMYVRTIADLLDKRFMATIREQEGGTYGVSVRPSILKRPSEQAVIRVEFDCDPEKREKLTQIMKDEIDNMLKNGVNEDNLEELKNNKIKSRQESENQNGFWLGSIRSSLMNDEAFADVEGYNQLVEGMNAKSVQKFAKKLFKNPDTVEVVMVPKK